MMMRLGSLPLCLAALALVACDATRHDGRRWPVLLLTVDTLRPDYLSHNGYPLSTSPFLDELLAEGTVFEHAVAPVPRTTPSLASLLTGAYPHTTGVRTIVDRLPSEQVSLAEALQAAGYRTVGVVTNRMLGPGRGLEAGFDVYDAGTVRTARATSQSALQLVAREDPDAPLFLWFHFFDPHVPYHPDRAYAVRFDRAYRGPYRMRFGREPRGDESDEVQRAFPTGLRKGQVVHRNAFPPAVNGHIRRLYAGEIRSLDDRLRELVTALRALYPDLVIVFTADHGESLGEHDYYFDHGEYVYDASSRVPLAIVLPESHPWHGAHRCTAWVSLVDVAPTLFELLGLEPPPEMAARFEGRSLAPCLRGEALPSRPVFVESGASLFPKLVRRRVRHDLKGRFRAVTSDGWKLIWTPFAPEDEAWELYDLAADPSETRNLYAPDHPEAARLRPLLEAWLERGAAAEAAPHAITEEDLEGLRLLGYVE